jgi:hypothetical protein
MLTMDPRKYSAASEGAPNVSDIQTLAPFIVEVKQQHLHLHSTIHQAEATRKREKWQQRSAESF